MDKIIINKSITTNTVITHESKPITRNTVITHKSNSHETNLRKTGSKAILQFHCHHKLYGSVHMHFHPGLRLCDHKLTDPYHFFNIV